jgi:hypothetical protein
MTLVYSSVEQPRFHRRFIPEVKLRDMIRRHPSFYNAVFRTGNKSGDEASVHIWFISLVF